MRENIVFNSTETAARTFGGQANFVRNSYIGGTEYPLWFKEEEAKMFLMDNFWKYDLKEDRWLTDIVTYGEFPAPRVKSI